MVKVWIVDDSKSEYELPITFDFLIESNLVDKSVLEAFLSSQQLVLSTSDKNLFMVRM